MIEIERLRHAYNLKRRKNADSHGEDEQLKFHELDVLQAEFGPKLTQKFRDVFSELFLDLPPYDENGYWKKSNFDGNYSLTDQGMNVAYARLRAHKNEIEESRLRKYTIWVGVLGAISGLIAVATPILIKLIDSIT